MIGVPNFQLLVERLLAPTRLVCLVPHDLVDDGYTVRFVPDRDGVQLACELKSVPTLDLTQAGMETDRRPETILDAARVLLRDRKFTVIPRFDILSALAVLPLFHLNTLVQKSILELQAERPLLRPAGFDIENELRNFFDKLPRLSFALSIEGEPVKGLDISRPISGVLADVVEFLTPLESYGKGTPLFEAVKAAIAFHHAKRGLSEASECLNKYVEKYGKRWWFKIYNKTKPLKHIVDESEKSLHEATERAAAAIAMLPA